jgi:uncharacterized protein (TIGR03118 family)
MLRRMLTATLAMAIGLMFSSSAVAQYKLQNLDSNQVHGASHDDPLIGNAWGLVHAPGSPWWISDNTTGWSTLYDGKGAIQGLRVVIPTAGNGPDLATGGNGPGSPTGIVFNGTVGGANEFPVQGFASIFLFDTIDGTISGWAPQVNANQAVIAVDNSSKKASYTGLAVTSRPSGNFLYAADNANNAVDVYDANFNFVKSFTDSTLTGFSVFGVQDINGLVYVTFAATNGGGGGFVEQFREDGTPVNPGHPLISGFPLNQPWGVAGAPAGFGPLSGTLLISNNTNNGTIHAFDPFTGQFVGTVKDFSTGKPIVIDQLWGIAFGDGKGSNGPASVLYFTAGPGNNLAGTFGSISFKP